MKECISCGMPMEKKEDFAAGDNSKVYCCHCCYPDGRMHSYEDAIKVGTEYMQSQNGGNYQKAKADCIAYLKSMPAWKDK